MFVGRSDELGLLDRLLAETAAGAGASLLVLGDPGSGVTAALDAAARRAGPRLRVLRLRACSSTSPHALLHDLAVTVGARDDSTDAVADALRLADLDRPGVLLVDDAHLADTVSLEALAEVSARVPTTLTLVGWCCGRAPVPPAMTGWDRLLLRPLEPDAALAIARAAVGQDAPVLRRLVERLGGNARALRDVPPSLAPQELEGRSPLPEVLPVPAPVLDSWAALLPTPGSVQDGALLEVALCLPCPPAVGLRGVDLETQGLAAGCDLVRSGPSGIDLDTWVRELVLARADPADRAAAHRRLARAAAHLGAAPSVVVHHLVACTDGVDDEVADELEMQARRADRLGLPDIGSTTWAAAALRSGDARRRTRRAMAGACGITVTGPGMAAVDDLLTVLEDADLEPEDAVVLQRLRTLQRVALDPDSRVASLHSAVEQARMHGTDSLPDLLWELSVLAGQHGELDAGVAAAEEYCALERIGSPGLGPSWTGTALLSAALFQAGRVSESAELRREVHDAARTLDVESVDLDTLFTAVALDDLVLDLSAEASERLLRLVQRLGGEAYPVACLYGIQGWRARARGDLATARRMLDRGMEIAVPASALDVVCGLGALAAELSAIQGDGQLERDALRLRGLMESLGDQRRLSTLDRALGLHAMVAGHLAEAVVHLSAAADKPMLGRGLRDGILMARVDVVEALVRADDRAAALARAPRALEVLDQMDDDLAAALSARVRALVAEDYESALGLLAVALDLHSRTSDEFEHARSHLVRGELLRRMRRRGEARIDLHESLTRFESIGAAPWAARAAAELRAAGSTLAPVVRSTGLGLTTQELAVARAVARGGSNREVADELFLSPRTVEYHLGNVYRKLGLRGRAALTARLAGLEASV